MGDIVIALKPDTAPVATANFVKLAEAGYYDGVAFHRLVPGFVIQGGDGVYGKADAFDARIGTGGPGYTIKDEPVVGDYIRGSVSMARTAAARLAGLAVLHRPRGPLGLAAEVRRLRHLRSGHRGHGRGRRHRGHAQLGRRQQHRAGPVPMESVTITRRLSRACRTPVRPPDGAPGVTPESRLDGCGILTFEPIETLEAERGSRVDS